MSEWRLRWGAAVLAAIVAGAVLTALAPLGTALAAQERSRSRDCDRSSVGLVPLIDLGAGTYEGATGGLYPLGSNEVPPAHLAKGLARAAEITPLDAGGEPAADGAVVFASLGFSNPQREFGEFQRLVPRTPNIGDSIVVVNGAQGGEHVLAWADPDGRPWRGLDAALAQAGVTAEQVQAVWIKMTQRLGPSPLQPFPDSALTYRDDLIQVIHLLTERLPNLRIAYFSSRTYGGYNSTSSPSPEPVAYEEGFGVKWVIERQIAGDPDLNADPAAGEIRAPWLAWGPYLWADGTTPRSDGLTWPCSDYRADGVHLDAGNGKVAAMLMEFLQAEPTAAWMFSDRELPPPPTDLGAPIPTSTIPGDAEPAPSTTAAPTTTVAPATTTTSTTQPNLGVDVLPPIDDDGDGLPALVWVLIGAGGALLVAAVAVRIAELRRRRRSG